MKFVTPAYAGVQAVSHLVFLVSGFRRNDETEVFTGMTNHEQRATNDEPRGSSKVFRSAI